MLTANLFLAALVLGFGLLGLAIFFFALFAGQFDHPEAQAECIFDEHDHRYWREWESADQQAARRAEHGPPLSARPGEWGGAR